MRAKIILNPSSGKQIVQKNLDRIIGNLIIDGVLNHVDVFATKDKFDALNEVKKLKSGEYDFIIPVGGDGTVNEVVNGIMLGKCKIPMAILPAGTVNDFGQFLNIPTDVHKFCNMIKNNKRKVIDVGKVGNRYFINVLAGGLLTDVGYKVSSDSKTVLGKYAYYIEGMKEFPKQIFRSVNLGIKSEEFSGEEDIFMFVITNIPTIGGFKKIAPRAQFDDGLLDVCIIKKSEWTEWSEVISLLIKAMKGEHINHPKVLYIQTPKIELDTRENIELDIDGEQGSRLPATIEVVPKALEIIVP